MIEIIKDVDIVGHFSEYDVILIGTNIYQQMAHGVQLSVMLDYPYAYNRNLGTKYGDPKKLGTILECSEKGEPTFCLCFICKGNFRPDLSKDFLSYESLEKCLKLVNVLYRGKRVATTLLGTSRFDGNGDRERVMNLFMECVKDVNLTIYDYIQKSRAEAMKEVYEKEQDVRSRDYEAYHQMVKERKEKAEERFRKNGHRRY